MSVREFFVTTWESEQPAFRKVIAALPADQLDYKPHERSTSAGNLAWLLVTFQQSLADMLDRGMIEWENRPRPATLEEILAAWDNATEGLRRRVTALDDAKWNDTVGFTMGGKVIHSATVAEDLWGFLLDMIHHRGQLSTYIRPMGGKVPAIYGPSGDATA